MSLHLRIIAIAAVAATAAQAATLLDIRTMPAGPVTPGGGPAGPPQDPMTQQGQWFADYATGGVSARPYEFYDNVLGSGGGFMNHLAIQGVVTNITFGIGPNPPITAFDVQATVTNDLPEIGPWNAGQNFHGEQLFTGMSIAPTTLYAARLTAEFAITDTANLPALWVMPYMDRQPYIVAANENAAAWYCWTPGTGQQDGFYYVPTWDLGDIPLGQSSSVMMQFTVPAGLPITDSRYGVLWLPGPTVWISSPTAPRR